MAASSHVRNGIPMAVRGNVSRLLLLLAIRALWGQNWIQHDDVFNASGVPSVTFSCPRFADLDQDQDLDLILAGGSVDLLFLENRGTPTAPSFVLSDFVTTEIPNLLASSVAVTDVNLDGFPDLVCGGYNGIMVYLHDGQADSVTFTPYPAATDSLSVGFSPAPAAADLNGDALPDLMIGRAEDGSVDWVPNTGTMETPRFTSTHLQPTGIDAGLYAFPSLGDLEGDGDADLLLGSDGSGLQFYRNTGSDTAPVWSGDAAVVAGLGAEAYFIAPTLADLNGDGLPDLVYGQYAGPLQYYRNTGTATTPQWTYDASLFGGVIDVGGASNPYLVDFDDDGDLDLFTGQNLGDILYFRNVGSPLAPAWEEHSAPFQTLGHSIYSSVTVADLNHDGHLDLLCGDVGGSLYYYRGSDTGWQPQASLFAGLDLGYWLIPRFIDMDRDGDQDVVVGNDAGELVLLENQGSPTAPAFAVNTTFFQGILPPVNCAPAIVDLDGDGDWDLLLGGISGTVECYVNDGTLSAPQWTALPDLVTEIAVSQNATPAVGDLNADGRPDLVVGDYDGLFHYYENQFSPLTVEPSLPTARSLIRAYPNPFNRAVSLEIRTAAYQALHLTVYDLTGRPVMTEPVSVGRSVATITLQLPGWAATGIYLYRVRTVSGNREIGSGKLLYLK
ncbi:MAG: T9SS C-terminal target domain-containing protein [Candidatus Neomarinimicrobiota bacterium]|nr:MAG: T9SS C-terminal target domain-containing protein [Candidatus Neomarinimicrobiota bacterium]